MASVLLAGISKRYGAVVALEHLDLEIRDGELMVVLGPSGSGKTTLLRLVAGLEGVTDGSIHVAGRDVTGVPPGKRNLSMVFQGYALFPHLDVAANIGFGLVARHVPPGRVRELVGEAASTVGCTELLDRYPDELSGGERQRVALARAIVREPDAFLLDEPLSNLDAQLRVQMRSEIRLLQRRTGSTMLYVTHDQQEGLLLGDRVAVLREGRLEQVGTPDEIYRAPENRFVARFVGSPPMNILPATLREGELVAGPFRFSRVSQTAALAERRLEVGIRPGDIRVALTPGDAGPAGSPGEVRLVESAGSETYIHVLAGGESLVVRTSQSLRPPIGSTVWVQAYIEACRVFDAETGAALDVGP